MNPIFTIGHGRLTEDEFFNLLKENDITVLIDVRSVPYSKHVPDYNYPRMSNMAENHNIEYKYLGKFLGGKPKEPELYTELGEPDYEKIAASDGFQSALKIVKRLAEEQVIALMCCESEPSECHRFLFLGELLKQEGYEIPHIYKDGGILEQEKIMANRQLELF